MLDIEIQPFLSWFATDNGGEIGHQSAVISEISQLLRQLRMQMAATSRLEAGTHTGDQLCWQLGSRYPHVFLRFRERRCDQAFDRNFDDPLTRALCQMLPGVWPGLQISAYRRWFGNDPDFCIYNDVVVHEVRSGKIVTIEEASDLEDVWILDTVEKCWTQK